MNNLSDLANFGELQIVFFGGEGRREGAPDGSLRPGRQKPSLRLWCRLFDYYIRQQWRQIGAGGRHPPPPPPRFQKRFFIGFIGSMFNICTCISSFSTF